MVLFDSQSWMDHGPDLAHPKILAWRPACAVLIVTGVFHPVSLSGYHGVPVQRMRLHAEAATGWRLQQTDVGSFGFSFRNRLRR